jgi:ferredoxin
VRVTIDPSTCVGHARCNARAPEVFDLDDGGYAVAPDGEVPAALEQQAQAGADACPERAITVA